MGTTRRRKATKRRHKKKMKAALFLLSALVASSQAVPKSRNELTCSICIDIITDLDNFIICPPFLDLPDVLLVFLSIFLDTSRLTLSMKRLSFMTGCEGAREMRQILFE